MTTTTTGENGPAKRRTRRRLTTTGEYSDRLQPDDQAFYNAASSELNLEQEIRMLRTVLASLAPGLPGTAHAMKEVASVLTRTIYVQARTLGLGSSLEEELMDAADLALNRLALEDLDGLA